MSTITAVTTPAQGNHAAFNPVVWGITTTRYDTGTAKAVTGSLANNGGKLKITTSSAHGLEANDIITIVGITGLPQSKSRVSIDDTTHVTCQDIVYSAAYTYSSATIQKTINNLSIRCQVTTSGNVIGVKYQKVADAFDAFNFDISGILSDYILSVNEGINIIESTVQTIVTPAQNYASVAYTLQFREYYDDAFDVQYHGSDLTVTYLSGAVIRAHNFAVQTGGTFTDYLLSSGTSKLLTNKKVHYLRRGEKFTFQFITTENKARLRIVRYGTGGSTVTGADVSISNGRGQVTIDDTIFTTTDITQADVSIYKTNGTSVMSEVLTFYPDPSCVRTVSRLQFKNLLGGTDSLYFNDNTQTMQAEAGEIRTAASYQTYHVFNDNIYTFEINANNTALAWLKELLLSKVTYFNGVRCSVAGRQMTVQSREFTTFQLQIKGEREILN